VAAERIRFDLNVQAALADRGFAWVPRASWSLYPELAPHLERLRDEWEHLEPDRYLEQGAKFRLRRYGRYRWEPASDALVSLPHEPYFQPAEENTYAGGVSRDFGPLRPETIHSPFVHAMVRAVFACLPIPGERRRERWEVRIHQLRIVASAGAPSFPTPEGIHQDGTDFLTLHLMRRDNISGGDSTIYDLDRTPVFHCTMREVLDMLVLEDPRVMHSATPVLSADGQSEGVRDIMGVDFHHRPHWAHEPH
jgi:hypothetical protein